MNHQGRPGEGVLARLWDARRHNEHHASSKPPGDALPQKAVLRWATEFLPEFEAWALVGDTEGLAGLVDATVMYAVPHDGQSIRLQWRGLAMPLVRVDVALMPTEERDGDITAWTSRWTFRVGGGREVREQWQRLIGEVVTTETGALVADSQEVLARRIARKVGCSLGPRFGQLTDGSGSETP